MCYNINIKNNGTQLRKEQTKMKNIKEMNAKEIKVATNEEYTTVLVQKENGNYAVLTKKNGAIHYNSFYRSFKTLEKAEKHFEMLK